MESTPITRLLVRLAKVVRDNVTMPDEERAALERDIRGVWKMLKVQPDSAAQPSPAADHGYGYDPETPRHS